MPRPKKSDAKGSGDSQRERTDDELKNSPTFHKQFYNEAKKQAENEEQRSFIERSFKESGSHDDFSLKLFEIDWFLEKYEDIFNSAKTSMRALAVKKEEAPPKQPEPIQSKMEHEEMDQNPYGRNVGLNMKIEPGYYSPYGQPTGHGPIYNQMGQMQMNPMAQMKSAYPGAEQYSPYQSQAAYPQQMPPQMAAQMPPQMAVSQEIPQQQLPPQMARQMSQQMAQAMPQMNQMNQMTQMNMSQQLPQQVPPHMQAQMQPAMPNMAQQMPPQVVPQQHVAPQVPLQQQTSQPAPQPARNIAEKEEKPSLKEPVMTMEFETNQQLRKKLYDIVPLNHQLMLSLLNTKLNKKATDGFFNGLHLAVIDYVRNLIDELRNICDMDIDAADMKNFMKIGGATNATDGDVMKNSLMGGLDGMGESKGPKHNQYLVKFSSLQEDQKQIEKLDDKEQKDLEDKYTMSKDDDEEKITKKVKKDVTEEDEIIKFLFRTKKDKNQDNENISKKIQDANMTLSKLTSRSYTQPTAPSLGDSSSQREVSGKGRKAGGKRITMKHLIYYLETNPQYKRTPLLHKAYLK